MSTNACKDLQHLPVIFTTNFGLLLGPVGTFSIFLSVNIPSITFPNTTCFPSKKSHFAVVMKNYRGWNESWSSMIDKLTWHPLVLGPELAWIEGYHDTEGITEGKELAMDRRPGPVCFSWKFSSCGRQFKNERSTYARGLIIATGNLSPYIENDPVPSPFKKSPPA